MPSKLLVVNICGEGEIEGAVNLNNLAALMRPLEEIKKRGELVEGDVLERWPFADSSVDGVIGNNLPDFSRREREHILSEARRILKVEGIIRIHSMSGKPQEWEGNIRSIGFVILPRESHGAFLSYVVGQKR